jgi:hypothetical protein
VGLSRRLLGLEPVLGDGDGDEQQSDQRSGDAGRGGEEAAEV